MNLVSIYHIKKQIIPSTSSSSSSSSSPVVKWKFDKVQSLECTGAAAVAVYPHIDTPTEPPFESTSNHHTASIPLMDGVILVCASYHDPQGAQVTHPFKHNAGHFEKRKQ